MKCGIWMSLLHALDGARRECVVAGSGRSHCSPGRIVSSSENLLGGSFLVSKMRSQEPTTHKLAEFISDFYIVPMQHESSLDTQQLIDFALGLLSPEESMAVLEILERDEEASRALETIIEIMNLPLAPDPELGE